MPERYLAGKTVIITGAGSGVGRASAELFAQHGANVVCADVRRPWVDQTVDSIEATGGSALAVTCDVARAEDVVRTVQAAVDAFGRLDVMFNNAGIASSRRGILLEDHTDEEFERLVDVNGRGVFHGCREAMFQFKRQQSPGVIVNTGSAAGMVAWGSAVYGATKAMVIQFTRALAIEAAPFGIRVNCICPGGMMTNFGQPDDAEFRVTPSEEEAEMVRGLHPLGQVITPADCAQAALYLASDRSANVTGIALPIDGGYIAR